MSATRTSPTRAQRSSRTTARGCGYRTQAGPDPGGPALRRAMRLRAGPTTHVRFEAIMEPRGEWTAVDRRQGAPNAADSQPPITPRPISAATGLEPVLGGAAARSEISAIIVGYGVSSKACQFPSQAGARAQVRAPLGGISRPLPTAGQAALLPRRLAADRGRRWWPRVVPAHRRASRSRSPACSAAKNRGSG